MNYRAVSTSIWTDDAILELSPEQKLVFLYLHTNPYASACGIYRLHLKTMSFQIGMGQDSFENALRGLCAVLPDFIAADFDAMEVGLLQYPKQTLIAASASQMKHVSKEIESIGSQYLIRELIARNSATISAPYLSQLRRLQMTAINRAKNEADVNAMLGGDVVQVVEDEETNEQTQIQTQTQTQTQNSLSTREEENSDKKNEPIPMPEHIWGQGSETRLEKAQAALNEYFQENPHRIAQIAESARNVCDEEQFRDELDLWLRRYADDWQITQNPVKALTSGRGSFISWLSQTWCREKYLKQQQQQYETTNSSTRNWRVQQRGADKALPTSEELRRKYGVL